MGAWPTDDLTSQYLDSGNDDPALARTELLALLQKVKAILAALGDNNGVCDLDSNGLVPESNHRIQTIPLLIGSNGSLWMGPSTWSSTKNGTGSYTVTHNLNHMNYVVIATAGSAGHICSSPSMYNDGATLGIVVRNDSGSAANADIYALVVTADATDYTWP